MRKFFLIVLFLSVLMGLSSSIDTHYYSFSEKHNFFANDFLYKIFGESRRIFSKVTMIKAEEYMHGGVTHPLWNTFSKKECLLIDIKKQMYHEGHDDRQEHTENQGHQEHDKDCNGPIHREKKSEKEKILSAYGGNILLAIADRLKIDAHIHIDDNEMVELLPWYGYAYKLDKHNTHAFSMAGYWLDTALGKHQKAIELLLEGLKSNPDSWEINKQIALTYYSNEIDYLKALRYFANAYKNIGGIERESYEKRLLQTFMSSCFEKLKASKEAQLIVDETKDYD